jgi:hypothetical protein
MKHPMQKVEDNRFVKNDMVRWLLDNGGKDLNDLAREDFSNEDREQFAQLIGYSLSGFSELSYVSDESVETAFKAEKMPDWRDARITTLEEKLEAIRGHLRSAAVAAFAVHPDSLQSTPE